MKKILSSIIIMCSFESTCNDELVTLLNDQFSNNPELPYDVSYRGASNQLKDESYINNKAWYRDGLVHIFSSDTRVSDYGGENKDIRTYRSTLYFKADEIDPSSIEKSHWSEKVLAIILRCKSETPCIRFNYDMPHQRGRYSLRDVKAHFEPSQNVVETLPKASFMVMSVDFNNVSEKLKDVLVGKKTQTFNFKNRKVDAIYNAAMAGVKEKVDPKDFQDRLEIFCRRLNGVAVHLSRFDVATNLRSTSSVGKDHGFWGQATSKTNLKTDGAGKQDSSSVFNPIADVYIGMIMNDAGDTILHSKTSSKNMFFASFKHQSGVQISIDENFNAKSNLTNESLSVLPSPQRDLNILRRDSSCSLFD